jgi:hypothetical protein
MDPSLTIFDLQNVSYAVNESEGSIHGAPMGRGGPQQGRDQTGRSQ